MYVRFLESTLSTSYRAIFYSRIGFSSLVNTLLSFFVQTTKPTVRTGTDRWKNLFAYNSLFYCQAIKAQIKKYILSRQTHKFTLHCISVKIEGHCSSRWTNTIFFASRRKKITRKSIDDKVFLWLNSRVNIQRVNKKESSYSSVWCTFS